MQWFRCFIEGRNFPGVLINEASPIGFYTTRFVHAESAEHAEKLVLDGLKNEKSLVLPLGEPKPVDARIFFEEIECIDQKDIPATAAGFTFFVMST